MSKKVAKRPVKTPEETSAKTAASKTKTPKSKVSLDDLHADIHDDLHDEQVEDGESETSDSAEKSSPTDAGESRGPDFLPFDAEFLPAPIKRFQETVVFVHHFGGNKNSLTHHVKMVNDLGYDAVRFDLMFSQINPTKHFPITADLKFGIRHVWSEQIEAILNSTPGRKILFSFSMPSNSVLMALAHRHAKDVAGWVCDGGPFLQLPKCVWNLYEHHYAIKSKLIRGALTGASLLFYGTGFEKEAQGLVRSLPRNFRILSFRGLQDPMVPADAIDEVLIGNPARVEKAASHKSTGEFSGRLSVETHSFEEGGHLDGLKNYGEAYEDHCETFLKGISKPV